MCEIGIDINIVGERPVQFSNDVQYDIKFCYRLVARTRDYNPTATRVAQEWSSRAPAHPRADEGPDGTAGQPHSQDHNTCSDAGR
eukprot:6053457-Pyramimonas_sp.AAC.1